MNVGKIEFESLPLRPKEAARKILATYSRDNVKALIALLQIGIGEAPWAKGAVTSVLGAEQNTPGSAD